MIKNTEKYNLIDRLRLMGELTEEEWTFFFDDNPEADDVLLDYAAKLADEARRETYGNKVFIRGLIEFTNYCRRDCLYCGIRRSNDRVMRYRMDEEEILSCCENGYSLGFRTFVLQGGEDPSFDEKLTDLVAKIRSTYPDCAITLSVGERPREVYQSFRDAGADRFLLRHETADEEHYAKLHPEGPGLASRKDCLWTLKETGFQVGAGFMVGSPYQSPKTLARDMAFLKELNPHMVGIGPFIPHEDTPFANQPPGTWQQTCLVLSMVRLMLPKVLLPATTALGTIEPRGREKGLMSGANVLMPNLSPDEVKGKYALYDNKVCVTENLSEYMEKLRQNIEELGYELAYERGDSKVIEE